MSHTVGRAHVADGTLFRDLIGIAAALSIFVLLPQTARADEPSGCDAFKWSLKREAELLLAKDKPGLVSGDAAKLDGGRARSVTLAALADAHLPQAPGRAPKISPSNAAFVRYDAPASTETVQITLSDAVWIDVLQDGKSVKAAAFSGARDCPGVRKSLRFPIAASPFIVEISGTNEPSIGIIAAPVAP